MDQMLRHIDPGPREESEDDARTQASNRTLVLSAVGMNTLAPGVQLGSYRIEEVLGHKIPINVLFAGATIGHLAQVITDGLDPKRQGTANGH